ncbi:MAG: response regulator transcription factor [Solirubrobacterales bacterium]|jgi:DNA-binding NarL/FixJ family response regulator|nr:response regulator transcription factor [Solirubrobacterales bacterium]
MSAGRTGPRRPVPVAFEAMTKLVIVDDHEALREGLAVMLGQSGLDVVGAAGNVAAGLDLVAVADPDVALIDIRLPDGDGIELTRELLAQRPALGVVLYTGDADAELLYDGLDSGARGYALKAGSMEELVAAIERVAVGGSYVDPRLDRILLSPRATAKVPQLSPREREIMHAMAEGLTAEKVGEEFGVSVETVRTHVRNVIRKLQARNRVHAIALALERGEIALGKLPE